MASFPPVGEHNDESNTCDDGDDHISSSTSLVVFHRPNSNVLLRSLRALPAALGRINSLPSSLETPLILNHGSDMRNDHQNALAAQFDAEGGHLEQYTTATAGQRANSDLHFQETDHHSSSSGETLPTSNNSECPPPSNKMKTLVGIGIMLVIIICYFTNSDTTTNHSKPTIVIRNRTDLVEECAIQLSNRNDFIFNEDSPQFQAVKWFIFGSGREISPPNSTTDCTWDSLFGRLYALLVLRGALTITLPSWNDDSSVVNGMSDICKKWHRISCNEDLSITRLHLSDTNFINGTIPNELSGFIALEQLELYKNYGISGVLPPKLSQISNLEYLHLHETSITGSIPSSFEQMGKLRELFVDRTNLSGKMPKGLCDLHSHGTLKSIHADCGGKNPRIYCMHPSCCTSCHTKNDDSNL